MNTLQKLIIGESTVLIAFLLYIGSYWHSALHFIVTIVLYNAVKSTNTN